MRKGLTLVLLLTFLLSLTGSAFAFELTGKSILDYLPPDILEWTDEQRTEKSEGNTVDDRDFVSGITIDDSDPNKELDLELISKYVFVRINGELVGFPDQAPYVNDDNRTLVPVRFLAQDLGADVEWEAPKVTITKDGKVIELIIGERTAKVNGDKISFDTSAVVTNKRTMVPLRFISEAFGVQVEWDGPERTVHIIA